MGFRVWGFRLKGFRVQGFQAFFLLNLFFAVRGLRFTGFKVEASGLGLVGFAV